MLFNSLSSLSSSSLLLLILITILIIIILSIYSKNKEHFSNTFYFDKNNINNVTSQLDNEITKTNKITNQLKNTKSTSNNYQCFSMTDDGNYKLNENENIENCNGTSIKSEPIMDVSKLTKFNNQIRNDLKTINFDNIYNNSIKQAIKKRHNELSQYKDKLSKDMINLKNNGDNDNKCLTITNDNKLGFYDCNLLDNQRWIKINENDDLFFKNPFTSKTLRLNTIPNNNNYFNIKNDNSNNKMKLIKNNIKLNNKCIKNINQIVDDNDNDSVIEVDDKLCDDDTLNYYRIDDKKEYIKNYNDILKNKIFKITKNNVDLLPNEFVYFTKAK